MKGQTMPIFLALGAFLALMGVAFTVAGAIVIGGSLLMILVLLVKKIVAPKAAPVVTQN
jgi:hypothetical protein